MIIPARNNKSILPELLSPAGSFDCLVAAVAAGADAIYVGGRRFGARAFAKNFDLPELADALTYCHLHGVKLYVTVNTLLEDKEIPDVVDYARELWKIGIDAIIISDLGAVSAIREALPEMELHASTQMSVHSTLGADAAYALGCKRVVLARELSLENIRSAVDNSKADIEVFLHGALCVCHSGQCLFSSLVGGRSGTRGECAQPCRLPYSTPKGAEYPLSLKDLSLADHIPALIESGVASLKIEGRMKSPGYVYTVTSIYRRLLDENRAATPAEKEILAKAFSRGGFTDGYLFGKLDFGMLGVRSEADKDQSRDIDQITVPIQRIKVSAYAEIVLGKPSKMVITDGVRKAEAFGEIPAPAENSPLTRDGVCERLSKMGNTYLSLSPEDIELDLDDGVNLSPAALNGLRRAAAFAFSDFTRDEAKVQKAEKTENNKKPSNPKKSKAITTAEFYSENEFLRAEGDPILSTVDAAFVPIGASDEAIKASGGVILPAVILDSELASAKAQLLRAKALGATKAVAQNIGQINLICDIGLEVFGGFRLNACNALAKEKYEELGVANMILSPELTLPKARDIGGGVITYGRIPLMLTERCFTKENFGCEGCGKASFIDRRGDRFPLMREVSHRNIILNSAITYMGDKAAELDRAGLTHRHLLFTNETAEQITGALRSISDGTPLPLGLLGTGSVRRMGRRDIDAAERAAITANQPKSTQNKPKSTRANEPKNSHNKPVGAKKSEPKGAHSKSKNHKSAPSVPKQKGGNQGAEKPPKRPVFKKGGRR